MFQKMKLWMFGGKRGNESSKFLSVVEDRNDPRELPRPEQIKNEIVGSLENDTKCHKKNLLCNCSNCYAILDKFSECSICIEPLQCAALCSCIFCGNYMCWNCSEKVQNCPFCRISFAVRENRVRNYALERLLSKFDLPCKYARNGCNVSLQCEERPTHEETCKFALPTCPLVGLCGWQGKPCEITQHLRDAHDVTIHTANEIDIEIRNFFAKLLKAINTPRPYTISLRYLGNIFICRLTMHQLKLRFVFFQIGSETAIKNQKFEAFIQITNNTRTLSGVVRISSTNKNNKEVVIPGRTILQSSKNSDHLVKISITIKAATPQPAAY